MLVLDCVLGQHLIIPVSIRIKFRIGTVTIFLNSFLCIQFTTEILVCQSGIIIRIGKFWKFGRALYGNTSRILDRSLSGISSLGSNHNDTISTTHTKDSCRSRILQNIDGLNIVRIHTGKIGSRAFNTIDNISR